MRERKLFLLAQYPAPVFRPQATSYFVLGEVGIGAISLRGLFAKSALEN
jgi:hypothetical protein